MRRNTVMYISATPKHATIRIEGTAHCVRAHTSAVSIDAILLTGNTHWQMLRGPHSHHHASHILVSSH